MTNYDKLKESFFDAKNKTEFARWIAGLFGDCEYNSACPACKKRKCAWYVCEGSESMSRCSALWLDWFNEECEAEDGIKND